MTEARAGGYRAALRVADYRRLVSALSVSEIGSWAYNVGLAVFAFQRTGSPGWVAAASLTRFITALLISPYAGVIAERFERVRLMVVTDLGAFAAMGLLAAVAAVGAPVPVALVFASLTSVATALYLPAVKATTPSIVGEDVLAAANSLESSIDNLAIIVGPAIGAALLLLGPPALAFGLNAVSFAYSAFMVSRIRTRSLPSDVTEGGAAGPLRQMRVGIAAIFSSQTVALLALFSVLATFVYGTDTVLYLFISRNLIGLGSNGYGYLLAGSAVGGVAVAFVMNRLAASPRLGTLIAAGMVVYCTPTALISVVHIAPVVVLLQVVRGAGTFVVDVLAMTAMQRLVPSDQLARVIGAYFGLVLAAVAAGVAVAPVLLGHLGLRGALLVMGLVIPAMVVIAYPRLRNIDSGSLQRLAQLRPFLATLQELDIFAGASRQVLERLAAACVEEQVGVGTVVIRQGDAADDFFVLVSGEVSVSATAQGRRRARALAPLTAPAYFGEIGLLENLRRTASVKAKTGCRLYRIHGRDFLEAMTAAPLSPGALGLAQLRLERTHPSRTLSFAATAQTHTSPPGYTPAATAEGVDVTEQGSNA